jgi:hypothetical protein
MQSPNTATFAADSLHAHLDVLFLRSLPETPKHPPLCRVAVANGKIRFATVFRRGAAGISAAADAPGSFELAISATRVIALKFLSGDIKLTATEGKFGYTTAGGASGAGETFPAMLVPEIELPAEVGVESAAGLAEQLALCAPFGETGVVRRGRVITAGGPQHSIAIEVGSKDLDWSFSGDAVPLARSYLKLVRGPVNVLSNDTKAGLAADDSWIVWPASVASEVAPLRPAGSTAERLDLSTEPVSTVAAYIVAEVGEDAWFDLRMNNGQAQLGWSAGGESVQSEVVAYTGGCAHRHLRLHGVDLGLLFRRRGRSVTSLAVETRGQAVVLTSTETTEIDGLPATIRRSAVACLGEPSGVAAG